MKIYAGGYLTFYMPLKQSVMELSLSVPTPLKDVLLKMSLPLNEIHLAVVNGELVDVYSVTVQNTDSVQIFPAVNGG